MLCHRPRPLLRLPGLAVASLGLLAACARQHGAPPDYPPFASVPRSAADASIVSVSLLRVAFRFEEDGTYSRTVHDTYKILTQDGVEGWGATEARWSPWHMDRPMIRATVTSPDGAQSRLEPSALSEAPAYPEAPDMYGDERVLRGPLPNVSVGSVVDEEIVTRTTRPYLGGAETQSLPFQVGVPREKVELVIDLPERLPFRYEIRDAKVTVSDVHQNGRRVVRFTGGPYGATKPLEQGAPSNVVAWPRVSFTTGTAWKPLAAAYARATADKTSDASLEPVVAQVVRPADAPADKAVKLLAWMRERVRYVGIEFGDSSIVPRGPTETLRHGYGDCKDQAVLLVALLRAAGLSPRVALLDSGFDEDIDPALPALSVFNHAIVVVPGKDPLWIDPTATRARVGELPSMDQGRYALVVDDDTEGLVRTPHASERENTYREVRQVFLPEHGGARVVETSTASGSIERGLRDNFDVSAADGTKWVKDYVSKTYSSQQPGHFELSNAGDLTKPFSMSIEAGDARVSTADLLDASVDVSTAALFGWVPPLLQEEEQDRHLDMAVPVPYRAELDYEIHPPAGFVLDDMASFADVVMGPATLRRNIQARPDGVVLVRYDFVLPKSAWTAAEVNEFRKAYQAFGSTRVAPLRLVHQGVKEHKARHFERELEIYRRDVQLHSQEAVPKMRLAQALLELGFGASARRLASEAMKLAPEDGYLWGYTGYIRSRDMLGRWDKPGWDLDGAIQAYREAVRVEPTRIFARANLATMLEYDPTGRRYTPKSRLEEAVATLDAADPVQLAAYDKGEHANSAIYDLFWLGRYEDVRARIAKMDPKKAPAGAAIVTAGMLGGPNAALAEATKYALTDSNRSSTLQSAAQTFLVLRRYPEAAALLSAAAEGSSDTGLRHRAEIVAKTRKIDAAKLPTARPEEVVRKVIALCATDPATLKDDLRLLVSKQTLDAGGKSMFSEICRGLAKGMERGSPDVPHETMADLLDASTEYRTDGSDALGYRLRFAFADTEVAFFVVREGRGYQLRASSAVPEDLGCEALAMQKASRKAAAVQWLDWARQSMTPSAGNDPLRDPPFLPLWTDKKDEVELAAAALCAGMGHPELPVATLRAARAGASGDRATAIDHALALSYSDGAHDTELLAAAAQLERDAPTSDIAWYMKRGALARLGRLHELRDESAARLARDLSNADRLWDLAAAEDRLGHVKEARAVGERLIATNRGGAAAYNEQAWRALFIGAVTEQDLGYALKAVNAKPNSAAYMNTLAAIDIALGHTADAREHLVKAIDLGGGDPGDGDWYVLGRIAEQLGLPDEARAAYERISPRDKTAGQYSSARLAEMRLRAMK